MSSSRTFENQAAVSIAFRKSVSAAGEIGYCWYITSTLGKLVATNSEAPRQYSLPSNRKILLKIGKEGVAEEVDYASEATSRAGRLTFPEWNTARMYESFVREGGEVVIFEDALKTHRLLAAVILDRRWHNNPPILRDTSRPVPAFNLL